MKPTTRLQNIWGQNSTFYGPVKCWVLLLMGMVMEGEWEQWEIFEQSNMNDPIHSIFLLPYYHISHIKLCIVLLS